MKLKLCPLYYLLFKQVPSLSDKPVVCVKLKQNLVCSSLKKKVVYKAPVPAYLLTLLQVNAV